VYSGVNEMSCIRSTLNASSAATGLEHRVSYRDVLSAFRQLKAGKSGGSFGLVSDYVIHACDDFGICVAMLVNKCSI